MNKQQMREECAKIADEWGVSGVAGATLYEDFAIELADRVIASLRAESDHCCFASKQPHQNNRVVTSGYVYVQSEPGLWTVGFFDPWGEWHPDSDHGVQEEAAKRVAWLNGANVSFAE